MLSILRIYKELLEFLVKTILEKVLLLTRCSLQCLTQPLKMSAKTLMSSIKTRTQPQGL